MREIYHFHFSNWPDFGEPRQTGSFLKFLSECRARDIFNANIYGPPVVHCSAGVGRSGTFILVDSILEMVSNIFHLPKWPFSILSIIINVSILITLSLN